MHYRKYILNWFLYAILLFLLFFAVNTRGQEKPNLPHKQIKVQKETDENGNIIRYDSTWFYSYSGSGDEINLDSLFGNFNRNFSLDFDYGIFFNNPFPGIQGHLFPQSNLFFDGNFFNTDSLLKEQELLFEKIFGEEPEQMVPDSIQENSLPQKRSNIRSIRI